MIPMITSRTIYHSVPKEFDRLLSYCPYCMSRILTDETKNHAFYTCKDFIDCADINRPTAYLNEDLIRLKNKPKLGIDKNMTETREQKTDRAFLHVKNDPKFTFGHSHKFHSLDEKRFVIEMYEEMSKKILSE